MKIAQIGWLLYKRTLAHRWYIQSMDLRWLGTPDYYISEFYIDRQTRLCFDTRVIITIIILTGAPELCTLEL